MPHPRRNPPDATRRDWLLTQLSLALGLPLAAASQAFARDAGDAPRPAGMHWVAAWAAAERNFRLTLAVPGLPALPPAVLQRQTVRIHVQPAIGGAHWRVLLSNRGSETPMVLDGASLALSTAAATLSPRSIVPLRFGGDSAVTIAPDATRWSDPLQLPVRAGQTLALSFHLAQPFTLAAGFPTQLTGSSWVMPGNQCQQPQPQGAEPLNWAPAFLALDTLAPRETRLLVAFGDSLTEGMGAGAGDARQGSYPQRLADRLRDHQPPVSVVNAGIAGNRLLGIGNGGSALERLDRDVLRLSGATHVLVLMGINDIGFGTLQGERATALLAPADIVEPSQLIAGLQQLAARARGRGLKVLLGTLPPFAGAPNWSEDNERKRQAVNRWIRSHLNVEAVVDFDAALRDPAMPARLNPAFDSGDHLHPSFAGLAVMADAVNLDVLGA